jgi:hypothetical protein
MKVDTRYTDLSYNGREHIALYHNGHCIWKKEDPTPPVKPVVEITLNKYSDEVTAQSITEYLTYALPEYSTNYEDAYHDKVVLNAVSDVPGVSIQSLDDSYVLSLPYPPEDDEYNVTVKYTVATTDDYTGCEVIFSLVVNPYERVEPTPTKVDVSALIPYYWNQVAPFNGNTKLSDGSIPEGMRGGDLFMNCPQDIATTYFVVGCTNIAQAMLLNYYANIGINGVTYRKGGRALASYRANSANDLYTNPLPTITAEEFNFDALRTCYTKSDFNTDAAKIAIAKLCKYLAMSQKSSISATGTGGTLEKVSKFTIAAKTMNIDGKIVNAWAGLNLNITPLAKLITPASVGGIEEFKEILYQEISTGHPVFLSTDGYKNGKPFPHTYLCDGYRVSDGYFHLNIGDAAEFNGWYNLENAAKTTSSGNVFNFSRDVKGNLSLTALMNIHPEES